MGLKHSLGPQTLRKNTLERRQKWFSFDCIVPPLGRCSTFTSPSRSAVSPLGKEIPRWTFSFSNMLGHFQGDLLRYCLTQVTGEVKWRREGDGVTAVSSCILDHVPAGCGVWVEIPNSGCAHLESETSGLIWPESSVIGSSFSVWVPRQHYVSATEHSIKTCMDVETSQWPYSNAEHSLQPHNTRKSGQRCQAAVQD